MLRGQILSANPLVAVYDDVFDADEAGTLIALGAGTQVRAAVIDAAGETLSEARTNTAMLIDQWASPVAADMCTRVAGIVRLPPENCEGAKILRYEGEQEFKPHSDGYVHYLPAASEQLANGGQRLFTALCYLNDVAGGGGQTEFPALKLSVTPKLGRVLLFSNTVPGTTDVHPHAIHAGRAVNDGLKWVMSLWWRENLYHVPRSYPEETGETLTV